MSIESVVLLSERGSVIGTAEKSLVHTEDTALHLAFSCYLFNDQGEVLITRRALSKQTWPGVWTNSFCGHPAPDELILDAVRRRADFELGVAVSQSRVVLPEFRYRAVDSSGIVENEICPVFTAQIAGELNLNPDEVVDSAWVKPVDLAIAASRVPAVFSPWLVLQLRELEALGLWGASG